jgi:hypothetical protein
MVITSLGERPVEEGIVIEAVVPKGLAAADKIT